MSRYLSDNVNSFNVSNVSNHFTVADHRSEILAWLSPLEPQTRHQDIRTRRVNGVGSWLLQTEEFRSWCDGGRAGESDNATLFCCGNPGVGKTYIR
ncbi:hypothetical protein L873DRAFT_719608 [Choiromyces venosus 120613-1]|uniref:Nephrocystin 3-like N-terminal domain-containing protein n=1 Tax=Choiromyces venosus 120613-1 TaxID=1336337 RepID=A0A3N4JRL7_9PEZI|nr:hypothetical protein L873DRAFT_719608 [Choiromyces venosus 120613-1]